MTWLWWNGEEATRMWKEYTPLDVCFSIKSENEQWGNKVTNKTAMCLHSDSTTREKVSSVSRGYWIKLCLWINWITVARLQNAEDSHCFISATFAFYSWTTSCGTCVGTLQWNNITYPWFSYNVKYLVSCVCTNRCTFARVRIPSPSLIFLVAHFDGKKIYP